MNILFVSSEIVPFAKTGGLADVSGALPQFLNKLGYKCYAIMPYYKKVEENIKDAKIIKKDNIVKLGKKEYKFNLLCKKNKNTKFYFIDNKELFFREQLYGTPSGDYPDNAIRFAFFSKAVIESLKFITKEKIDIIHSNDWQSSLIALYLKNTPYKNIKTLFTIHNMAYQGTFEPDIMSEIDIPLELFTPEKLEFYGKLNFMKAGIIYSDAISTVSKKYSQEIQTPEFGCGLDGLLRTRSSDIYGILNGADYNEWNPKTDKHIAKNYNTKNLEDKMECKKDLLKYFKLKFSKDKPVLGVVTRLSEQKGIDLIAETIEKLFSLNIYFILLGTGEQKFHDLFEKISIKYKDKTGIKIDFDNTLAHKIEAGVDMFLMPSRYEPCGLNQMYSLKYGTVPVVRATGGLDDTIEDFNIKTEKGNGFKFKEANVTEFTQVIKKAIDVFKNENKWKKLQLNAMRCNFSWEESAKSYQELYNKIIKNG